MQAIRTLRYYAGWADKISGQTLDLEGAVAQTYREPLGAPFPPRALLYAQQDL